MRSIPLVRLTWLFGLSLIGSAAGQTWIKDPNVHPSVIDDEPALTNATFVASADGRILVFGRFTHLRNGTEPSSGLVYLRNDGTVDETFNPAQAGVPIAAIPLSDGGVFGAVSVGGGWEIPPDSVFFRLRSDGSVDPTYSPLKVSGTVQLVRIANGSVIVWHSPFGLMAEQAEILRLNADGTLDESFNQRIPELDSVVTVAGQSDGKLLVSCRTRGTGTMAHRSRLVRLNASGSLDTTFSVPDADTTFDSVVVDAAGRILVTQDGQLRRLNGDGSVDTTFQPALPANTSVRSVALGANQTVLAQTPTGVLVLDETGALVTSLATPWPAGQVVRLKCVTSTGSLVVLHAATEPVTGYISDWRLAIISADKTHADEVDLGLRNRQDPYIQSAMLDPQSRLILTGNFNEVDGAPASMIVRLKPDGTRDASYSPALNSIGEIMVVAADSAAVISDSVLISDGTGQHYETAMRLVLADGTIDPGYSPPTNIARWHAMTADHRALVSRFVPDSTRTANLQLLWLSPDGAVAQALSTTFGGFGGADGFEHTDPITFAKPLPDGSVIVGGEFATVNGTARPIVAKLLSDGSLDPTYTPEFPATMEYATVEAPDASNRVVVTGTDRGNGTNRRFSMRLLDTGRQDPTYFSIPVWPAGVLYRRENGLPDLSFPQNVGALDALDGSRWTLHPVARYVKENVATIIAGPATQSVQAGEPATFYGVAGTNHHAVYQWLHEGVPIASSSEPVLTITGVTAADAGHYQVQMTVDGAVVTSDAVLLNVTRGAGRVMNVSTLARATSTHSPILGFGVSDDGEPRRWLVRAISDGLRPFGLTDALPQPELWLANAAGDFAHDRGNAAAGAASETASRVGAFPAHVSWNPLLLPNAPTSDSALVPTLDPGSYTARASGATRGAGWVLLEVYDSAIGGSSGALKNASVRNTVEAGNQAIHLGFVIAGPSRVRLFLRGVGPALHAFGIPQTLSRPRLTLCDAGGHAVAQNAGWADEPAIAAAAKQVGAFPYPTGSSDAAVIVDLDSGAYTASVKGAPGEAGEALVELYTLPQHAE